MVGKVHLVLHTVLCITLNIVLKHTSHNAAHGCHKYSKCYECCLKYSKCYDCQLYKYSSEVESAEKCHEGFGASQQRSQLLFRTWNNFFNCHVGTNPCAILQIFKPVLKSGVDASLKKTALGKPAMVVPNPLNIYIYWIIVFLIIFTMILMIILLKLLMTTLMIIGMRERPGAPIIGPAGRLADRHQPGLCHHRQHCHHHNHHHHQRHLWHHCQPRHHYHHHHHLIWNATDEIKFAPKPLDCLEMNVKINIKIKMSKFVSVTSSSILLLSLSSQAPASSWSLSTSTQQLHFCHELFNYTARYFDCLNW